ncbi:SPOR domain-containing protein [Commensalibacter papalotli (ex Servin-Garciduenas et al. 2014)]|uniref:SPOR domain-containing protein n=1 Tax=Commensalibacter papalotli (ex Servin-Garciduenas et al. 2014) TaxID=1208583 RepID=W7DWE5_9PROT|nr:SPOR domain-containing protein [Commensalibacter papalotli (ex Servin-Garciduenas et al. 2014)]EUK19405.1 hypothetical protein COMX_06625 [Commensalibacter papalotli (ex Servin-Garciduenas et al. 2014)]
MIDPNSPDPSKRKSFFDEDSLDDGGNNRSPHPDQRVYNDRERMTSRYHDDEDEEDYGDQDYDRRKPLRFGFMNAFGGGSSDGNATRRLAYAAGGVGAILVIFIGGWMFLNSSNKGVPVFEPPAEVAKVKPVSTGNVETIGMGIGENALNNGGAPNGQPGLASGPEQANPQALADQYNRPTPPTATAPSETHSSNNTTTVPSASSNIGGSNEGAEETPKHTAHPKHQQTHRATEPKKAEPKKVEPKKTTKKAEAHQASSGKFGLQLASLKSHDAAQQQWQTLKKKAPEILGKYSPSIQKAEVNGSAVYRLRVKGLTSKAQVSSVCAQLKAKGVACTIAY